MKILFFSDIHGIPNNLHVIKEEVEKNKIDKIICLGDLYYSYSREYVSNRDDVHKFLTSYKNKLICMRGNCDSQIDVDSSDFVIHNDLLSIQVDGFNIYLTHGNHYSYEKRNIFNYKGILVYGHEHVPYIKKDGDAIYICVGSISLPRGGVATYCIYENRTFTIYDINGNIVDSVCL